MKTNFSLYALRVTLLEDLHTGTGTGARGIDSAQALDRSGYPVIRATHVRGVLRAAAEELIKAEQDGPSPRYTSQDLEKLFGTKQRTERRVAIQQPSRKQRGALVQQSLYISQESLRRSNGRLVWASTARTKEDRSPKEDTLRSVEYVAAGTQFQGLLGLRNPSPEMTALLEACIRRTDTLGSHRTRGDGLIHIEMEPASCMQGHGIAHAPRKNECTLRLIVRNLDPLCLPITGNPGNIIPSECYIRGQRLLGALAAWEIESGTGSSMLFGQQVRVGDALPLPEGIRGISQADRIAEWDVCPIPLSIHSPKSSRHSKEGPANDQPWWMKADPKENLLVPGKAVNRLKDEDGKDEEKLKRPKDGEFLFRRGSGEPWLRYHPEMGVQLRNRVPEDRNSKDEGSLYSQEEIAEATLFLSDIHFDDEETATKFSQTFEPVLKGEAWLTMGRGGRPLVVVGCCWLKSDAKLDEASEQPQSQEDFTFTLQSDLIARSDQLGFYETLDAEVFARLVQKKDLGEVHIKPSFVESVEIRGFNAASGLPKAPSVAIRRGSAVKVTGKGAFDLKKRLERLDALGERTWEGFGRFRVNFNPLDSKDAQVDPGGDTSVTESPNPDVGLRETILEASHNLAKEILGQKLSEIPGKNQWQYLRQQSLVALSREQDGHKVLFACFDTLNKHKETKGGEKWQHAKLPEIRDHAKTYYASHGLRFAVLFVESLVRWMLVKLKEKEESK